MPLMWQWLTALAICLNIYSASYSAKFPFIKIPKYLFPRSYRTVPRPNIIPWLNTRCCRPRKFRRVWWCSDDPVPRGKLILWYFHDFDFGEELLGVADLFFTDFLDCAFYAGYLVDAFENWAVSAFTQQLVNIKIKFIK